MTTQKERDLFEERVPRKSSGKGLLIAGSALLAAGAVGGFVFSRMSDRVMAERPPLVGTETPVSRGEPAAPVSEYPTRVSPRAPETSKDVEDARGVLSAYFNAISDSDLDSIYSNITGSFREDRWRKVSTEELREWNERGAVGRYKIREGKKKNGSVQFLVDEHKTGYKPDGTPEERKSVRVYTLVSQNGEWKVNSRQIEKYWKDR